MLGQVYGHEAETRERGLKPEERLQFHQERSGWKRSSPSARRSRTRGWARRSRTYCDTGGL
jgi:hypothetical protein